MNQMKRNKSISCRPLCAILSSISSSSSTSSIKSPISLNCNITISVDSIINDDDEKGR